MIVADLVTNLHVGHHAVDLASMLVAVTSFAVAVIVAIRLDRRAAAEPSDDKRAVR